MREQKGVEEEHERVATSFTLAREQSGEAGVTCQPRGSYI